MPTPSDLSPTSVSSPSPTATAVPTPFPTSISSGGASAAPASPAATPTQAPAPSIAPQRSATVTPRSPSQSEVETVPEPPPRDLLSLARRLRHSDAAESGALVTPVTPMHEEGDAEAFWVMVDSGGARVEAIARKVSKHAYWFFDTRVEVDPSGLEKAVRLFEEQVWPALTRTFGSLDGIGAATSSRITILHTSLLSGAGGYFSSRDAFPSSVVDFSNERKIIYVSSEHLHVGSEAYMGVLAHELQHAIHFAHDPFEEAWLNEGLSELAVWKAGFSTQSHVSYLERPDTQLNDWPDGPATGSSYGAALLFTGYLAQRFGDSLIKALVAEGTESLASLDSVLSEMGHPQTANGIFADWLVANYLDGPGAIHGHAAREVGDVLSTTIRIDPERPSRSASESVSQFGADYYTVTLPEGPATVSFQGEREARLLPTPPLAGTTCWWGNGGDAINSTLTHTMDLRSAREATLVFDVWYSIEELWDYAYVEASEDGGDTWEILDARTTTTRNPNGTAYGPGFTGESGGWIEERVDLSDYAGQEALIRFEYVTDGAVHRPGICIDDVEVPQIGLADPVESDGEWQAEGFVRTDGAIPQEWLVQVVRLDEREATVSRVPVNEEGTGVVRMSNFESDEEMAVIVSAVSGSSKLPSSYTVTLESR